MERPFDDAAMLHFIGDSLFRTDSPLHPEYSISLERFIAERIASRESEWLPCLPRDLHSCSQKFADNQAKVIELEQRINALQTTAASATAATDHRVDTLQPLTENATKAAVSELRSVEHELSQCYALLNEFVRVSSQQPSNNFKFPQRQSQLQPRPKPQLQPFPQHPGDGGDAQCKKATMTTTTAAAFFEPYAVCNAEQFTSPSTTTTSTTTCLRPTSGAPICNPACSNTRDSRTSCRTLE